MSQVNALYDQLLESDDKHFARMRKDAQRAGQGINTGFQMHSRDANGDWKDFNLWLPKYAITMICARTGGGKTTWMTNIAMRLALGGSTGLFITLEEPGYAIRAKMLASYSMNKNQSFTMQATNTWNATRAISGRGECEDMAEFDKNIMTMLRIIDANVAVNLDKVETPSIMYQPQEIANLIKHRNSKSIKPLDFVIIDFGQLMETKTGDNSNSYQRMKAVMQACKNLSGALGIAVIIGAQLQRSCSSIEIWDWVPEMIRDGSDMEQAAALILATGQDNEYSDKSCNMAFRVLKNRYGPKRVAGMFPINFEYNFIPVQGRIPEDE